MSNLFDKLEIPTIEDVIKKYEVAPKNNPPKNNVPVSSVYDTIFVTYCAAMLCVFGFGGYCFCSAVDQQRQEQDRTKIQQQKTQGYVPEEGSICH